MRFSDYEATACEYNILVKSWAVHGFVDGDLRLWNYPAGGPSYCRIHVGKNAITQRRATSMGQPSGDGVTYEIELDRERGVVPISGAGSRVGALAVNLEVECERTAESLAEWQLATYRSIMAALGRCSILLALLSMGAPIPLTAQSGEVVELELQEDPALEHGQVAIVEGVADAEGLRYSLSDLSILQPIAVTLLSLEENPTLEMSLHVSRWDEAVRTAMLDGEIRRTLKFRTQGGVGIHVRSPDGRPQQFDLVAWVGSEIEPKMDGVIVSPERYSAFAAANPELYPARPPQANGGADRSHLLTIIAVLLAGVLVLLAILVFRQVKR